MNFITVTDHINNDEENKVYLNINAITTILLTPDNYGRYRIHAGGNNYVFVKKEDCQRVLDTIQKYSGRP